MFEEHTEIQFKSKAEIEAFQNERLQKAIEYVSKNSPYYKRLFAENNINVADIKTVADLQKIPVIYPFFFRLFYHIDYYRILKTTPI